MKYIDADKLIAEIHKHIGKYDSMLHEWSIQEVKGKREEAFSILTMVETLQHEQPEVDLEKEIEIYFGRIKWGSMDMTAMMHQHFEKCARHFYELGLKARKEDYEGLCAEREIMLKYSQPVHKINYPDGTFIFRTKSLTMDDLDRWGYERGDQLRFVIVKTPLAEIVNHKK